MMNTFLRYSLISGAISTIYFAILCQVKELWNISEKDWLTYLTGDFYCHFYTQKHPRGASIHEIKELFPLKPALVKLFLIIYSPSSKIFMQVNSWNNSIMPVYYSETGMLEAGGPYLNQGGGTLYTLYYYVPPRIFRPCNIQESSDSLEAI